MPLGHEPFGGGEWVPGPLATECLEWRGATLPKGYGRIRRNGRIQMVHRVALEIKLGRPIREGYLACHACDNPPCFNPAHLFEGTWEDNFDDMVAKGRGSWQQEVSDALRATRPVTTNQWADYDPETGLMTGTRRTAPRTHAANVELVSTMVEKLEKQKVAKDARIHIYGYSYGGDTQKVIVAGIRKAGWTDIREERGGIGLKADAVGCDCSAWSIEVGYGSYAPAVKAACIVQAHRDAKRKAEQDKMNATDKARADGRSELRGYLEGEFVGVQARYVWPRILLWQLIDWNLNDFARKRNPEQKKPDAWGEISKLTDAEVRSELAHRLADATHDENGVKFPWERLLAELRGEVLEQPPAKPVKAKGQAAAFPELEQEQAP